MVRITGCRALNVRNLYMNRHQSISPPPIKRRRIEEVAEEVILTTPPPSSTIDQSPLSDHLRMFSWNINGIQPFLQSSITSFIKRPANEVSRDVPITTSLRNFLRRHQWPQLVHLQEIKISPSDNHTKRAFERAINVCKSGPDDGPSYAVRFCLPTDKYNAIGFGRRVYGVATIIRQDFLDDDVESVRKVDWDLEGRILVTTTKSKLSIWNIYAVNGTTNPYRESISGEVVGTRHDRKLAMHDLLHDKCKKLEAAGYRVILSGDLNVAREVIDGWPRLRTKPEQHVKNRAHFNSRFFSEGMGLNLVDSFRHLHPTDRKYTWVARNREWKESCDRVDYFLISKQLAEPRVLITADILMTEIERGPSDHCPLYLEINLGSGLDRSIERDDEINI